MDTPSDSSRSDDTQTAAPPTRRFVILGQKTLATPDFSLSDIPGTSGRLDVLVRGLRAGLLVSHGVRRDTVVYLALLGTPGVPRTIRFDGGAVRFLRPDERGLASTVKSTLARARPPSSPSAKATFAEIRPGITLAEGGLDVILGDLPPGARYVLEESGSDVRTEALDLGNPTFFVGDHLGFDADTRAQLHAAGALPIRLGPLSLQADDAIAIMSNELDRRQARAGTGEHS